MDIRDVQDTEIWREMLSGRPYDALHPVLSRALAATREKIYDFNALRPSQEEEQHAIIREIFGAIGETFRINQPFRCDYGYNIYVGERFFANFGLTILDEGEVRIGDDCFIGPNVGIYTACHPVDEAGRNAGIEWSEPVTIGNSVWIGGNAVILPGVTIGDRCVIGAGAVVSRDIPAGSVAVGNPARVVKTIPDDSPLQV